MRHLADIVVLDFLRRMRWLKTETTLKNWQLIVMCIMAGIGGNIGAAILTAIFGPPFGG